MIAERKNKLNTSTNTHKLTHTHTTNEPNARAAQPHRDPTTDSFSISKLRTHTHWYTRTHIQTLGGTCARRRRRRHRRLAACVHTIFRYSWYKLFIGFPLAVACSGSGAALLSFIFIYISRFVSFYVYGLFRKQFAAAPTPSLFPVYALHCKVDSTELLICLCYTLTPSLSLPPSVFACVRVLCV